ncbi:transposase family protein [Aquabacterium sp.]|uniref:integrase catalytic domain-containing protein n=1 Tax=Aquabacterium sp. TaxID=1872578 RepID=UPI00261807DF|nr:transposase family protein [Aquabacterium sp.]MDD2977140.1 transposase family protein [Aquabacterium sp.]
MNPNHFSPWSMPPDLRTHIESIFRIKQIPQAGRNYVLHAIAQGPARKPQGRRGNACVRFVSKKLNASMMLESRTGEAVQAWMLELSETVRAFFAQPTQIMMPVKKADGTRATTIPYTPDFLIIDSDRIRIMEVRDGTRFLQDSKKSPARYFRDDQGRYRNLPAEEYFADLGLEYQLTVISDLPQRLVENVRFLEDYQHSNCPLLTDEERSSVVDRVMEARVIPLRALLDSGIKADVIYKAIAEGAVHIPLETTRLIDTESVHLFSDAQTALTHAVIQAVSMEPPPPIPGTLMLRSGSKISIFNREYDVLLEGPRDVLLRDAMGIQTSKSIEEIRQLHANGHATGEAFRRDTERGGLWKYPVTKVDEAIKRLRAVNSPHESEFSERSIARFRARIAGAANDLEAIELLIDTGDQRGNRIPRISETNSETIEKVIQTHYNTADRPTAKGAYEKYVKIVEGLQEPNGLPVLPVSLQTFTRRCKERMSVKAREGKRAAYQKGPIVALLNNVNFVHGLRPNELLYIDHTIANIETKSPSGLSLRKPTLTLAMDGCTHHCRSFVLLYEPASARTVMLLLRDYIARHLRVPRIIVVDNGAEFHSHELEYLCRTYGIEVRYRAPGMPRGGALVETMFGSIDEEFLSELEGNSRAMRKDTRLITGDMRPITRACWTLSAIHKALTVYLFEECANRVHPELGVSPNHYEEQRTLETGKREHMAVSLDETAMLLTSPHPERRSTRKVIRGRGVNVYGIYYRHPAMDQLKEGTRVEVRVEWWNASVVYVLIKGKWETAIGTSSRFLSDRSNREVEITYREHKRQATRNAQQDKKTFAGKTFRAVKLKPEDFDPILTEQHREQRRLYESLGAMGATARPLPSALAPTPLMTTSAEPSEEITTVSDHAPPDAAGSSVATVDANSSVNVTAVTPANDNDFLDSVCAHAGLR